MDWIKSKELLHYKNKLITYEDGDVVWCAIGQNVGYEINGKSDKFSRPVVVIKKCTNNIFIGIPLSTKINLNHNDVTGISFQDVNQIAILNQVRSFDARRVYHNIGKLETEAFLKIKSDFINLLK